jgi:uncharacterized UPF0160 family protein
VRSRDPEVLETCDIIVDVHGKYEPPKYLDHHQRGFEETFNQEKKTKLSSAGLVYKHFGREVIGTILEKSGDDACVDAVYSKVYDEFIEAIDANDNGISAYPVEVSPKFRTNAITLPSMVARLNPLWIEPSDDTSLNERFLRASKLMGEEFVNVVRSYGLGWYPAKQFVQKAFDARKEYDAQGRIVVFDNFVPWKEHLYNVEKDSGADGQVLYVLYSDGKGWRVQAVSESVGSFVSRKPLPEAWRGVRDNELSQVTGIPNCVFVHASGFIGGNQTQDGALQMARDALEL